MTRTETNLSHLNDHDWQVVRSLWMRPSDWFVQKVASRWFVSDSILPDRSFRTKREAVAAADAVILAESRNRAH